MPIPGLAAAIVGAEGPPPAFSYRNNYSDTTNQTNYSFASSDLGTPHSTRLVVVGVRYDGSNAVSSVTIGGVSATLAVASGNASRPAELWYAIVPSGETGTIAVNGGGAYAFCHIFVWAGYPASATPVDAVGAQAASGDIVISNLAKTAGGFACFVSSVGTPSATGTLTQTGAETITEDYEATVDGTASAAMSFIVTATTTTDDFTRSWSGADGRGIAGATWA